MWWLGTRRGKATTLINGKSSYCPWGMIEEPHRGGVMGEYNMGGGGRVGFVCGGWGRFEW